MFSFERDLRWITHNYIYIMWYHNIYFSVALKLIDIQKASSQKLKIMLTPGLSTRFSPVRNTLSVNWDCLSSEHKLITTTNIYLLIMQLKSINLYTIYVCVCTCNGNLTAIKTLIFEKMSCRWSRLSYVSELLIKNICFP